MKKTIVIDGKPFEAMLTIGNILVMSGAFMCAAANEASNINLYMIGMIIFILGVSLGGINVYILVQS